MTEQINPSKVGAPSALGVSIPAPSYGTAVQYLTRPCYFNIQDSHLKWKGRMLLSPFSSLEAEAEKDWGKSYNDI